MKYTPLAPSPETAGVVGAYWAYQGYQPPHAFERIFPAGTIEVVLNLTDDRVRCQDVDSRNIRELHGLVLTGVHRRPLVVDTAQQYSMLGIAFKPGGVRRFQATLGRLRKSRLVGWPELAWEMGYADQAHLIRDFQEFGGLSSTQYQSLQTS